MSKILQKLYDCEFLFFQTTKSKAKLNHYFLKNKNPNMLQNIMCLQTEIL